LDYREGMLAYAGGNYHNAIYLFERAIQSGHANAHAALAWLLQRVCIDQGMSKHKVEAANGVSNHICDLATRGARMGCR
jgi:TPR repeat protein